MRHNFLKSIAIVVLVFFSWTFGGGADIAFAMKSAEERKLGSSEGKANNSSSQQTKDSSQVSGIRDQQTERKQKTEEKLQKAVEDIERTLADTVADPGTKKARLKTKKTEIEGHDVEIRKEFAETEKKLKDSKLPDEILQRHYKFVKHYEDNLKELKTNLDAVDKAKTKAEADSNIEKTKKHLGKVKAPRKHQPLDPNKLPHRSPEVKKREPRTKPEEFSSQGPLNARRSTHDAPVLLAANGPINGLFDSPIPNTQSPTPVLLAVATLPSAADLAETIEVQFTAEIQAKATELNNNPVKIYNWVRNNIEYVPTYGSIQGANMCLQTKQCNDFDTSSLLIALLRAANIPAKYVYGTIELPIEKVMNWAGGFTDANAAIDFISTGGRPVVGVTYGGKIGKVRMEQVWVEAYIDYFPSRGARHKTGQGDMWVSLDASYKQYAYTPGIDIKAAVPFDAQAFIAQIQSTATIDTTNSSVTGVNSLYIQQQMQDYQTQVQNYISQNNPNATVGDVLGKKEVIKQEFPYLMGTLPYKPIVTGAKYAEIPDSLRHTVSFNVSKDMFDIDMGTPIDITKSLPEIAGKKITLSYSPATANDEAVINSYLPKPHADGTPIQPSELPSSLPAYLINVKPELRIDGQLVATGTSIQLGATETFTMAFSAPNQGTDNIVNGVTAGSYYAIAIDPGRISESQVLALKAKLEATKAKLQVSDFTGLTKDDILGDLLYTTALSYYAELDAMNFVQAKTMGIVSNRLPSETIFAFDLNVNYTFGVPRSVSEGGFVMDADRNITASKALDGDNNIKVQYQLASGMNSSALESAVAEQLLATPENPVQAISAVKALQIANDQGIPIYIINQTNIGSILPQLQLYPETIEAIQNAVNAGKEVTVSKTNINFNGWTGCGYIIIDPMTGEGAYMISGGLSGAVMLTFIGALLIVVGMFLLSTPVTAAFGVYLMAKGTVLMTLGVQLLTDKFTNAEWDCIKTVVTSVMSIFAFLYFIPPPMGIVAQRVFGMTFIGRSVNKIGWECLGIGIAY